MMNASSPIAGHSTGHCSIRIVRTVILVWPLLFPLSTAVAEPYSASGHAAAFPAPPDPSSADDRRNAGPDVLAVPIEYQAPDQAQPVPPPSDDLLNLDLEQLSQQQVVVPALQQVVTSVSRQESTVGRSPAAVFVITQDMIRRSGVTSIPEALRMAPGVQVARVNSNSWAITNRGFSSGIFANKLLVQIDGRTVYSPLFAGVFWDTQDVVLDDIERIEVIRGPGATVWGANAVNGVINIITKQAKDTQGVLVKGGGGTEEGGFSTVRVGGELNSDTHWRAYGKWFDREQSFSPSGVGFDDWRQGRGGFRMDFTPTDCDTFTVHGDSYTGETGNLNQPTDESVFGTNVLGRWTRVLDDESDYSVQFYYDRATRETVTLDHQIDTYDLDFQHRFPLGCRHKVIWGLGYRWVADDLDSRTPALVFDPTSRTADTFSGFVQDEIELVDDELYFTVGTKLEDNDYTDFEVQPSARLLYAPEQEWAAWAAVSRAVRTPSRLDHDTTIFLGPGGTPPAFFFQSGFQSEELIAYELGYRSQPVEWFSWDLALFYNQYEKLSSFGSQGFNFINLNENRGEGYGFEVGSQVDVTPCWHLSAWYSFLQLQIHPLAPDPFVVTEGIEGASPHNQVFLMSSWDIGPRVDFDLMGRYVDNLPAQTVPSYISMDARLAWRVNCNLELSAVGQNLLDAEHPEFGGTEATQLQRGVYGMLRWTY